MCTNLLFSTSNLLFLYHRDHRHNTTRISSTFFRKKKIKSSKNDKENSRFWICRCHKRSFTVKNESLPLIVFQGKGDFSDKFFLKFFIMFCHQSTSFFLGWGFLKLNLKFIGCLVLFSVELSNPSHIKSILSIGVTLNFFKLQVLDWGKNPNSCWIL